MLVSIIISIFNVEAYLAECIESVIQELKPDYEVILVNDGSTDNSPAIIADYKKRYPELLIINKLNGGLSSARNSGMDLACGKYLLFIDADDVLEAGVLDKLVYTADYHDADIVVADYYEFVVRKERTFRRDKALITNSLISEEERLTKLFSIDVSFAVWNKLYKADFIKNHKLFFLPGYWFEDLDFVFRAFYYANIIVKVDEALIGYRQREGSIMKNVSLKILDKMEIMDKIRDFLKNEGKFKVYEELYKVLYLKMMFSIIFACVKSSSSDISDKIIKFLFEMEYLKIIKRNHLRQKSMMKWNERLFYTLIKLKFVSPYSLSVLSYVKIF